MSVSTLVITAIEPNDSGGELDSSGIFIASSASERPIPFSLKERFHDGRRDHRGARLAAASRGRLLPRDLSRLRGPRRTSSFDGHLLPAACGRGLALASHRRGGNLALV